MGVVCAGRHDRALLACRSLRHRDDHTPTPKEALSSRLAWVTCGLAFGGAIAIGFGSGAFGEYISGYLIEKSLSVDNVFVWSMLFATMVDPAEVSAPCVVLGNLRGSRATRRFSSCSEPH